ncbi:DNA-damage-repair/toleration protein [Gossypium arboreum]|uniref:DNA-damage-repair/toleration protein n=1 Tax=Gossypium arboreum TaxID=29729 RepID=A0A0B0P045_GOSAR|nr:DNA-damage-repair/toleration protein [Gossypium arboreum]
MVGTIATMESVAITLFPFLLVIVAICCSFCDANSNVLCIESERNALLKFKNDLVDPSNRLSSWVEGGDCCKWLGVVCHNSTGHINQLHLAAPLPVPHFDAPVAEWEAYHRSKNNSPLRGKIISSLLELKHLSSLDLSNNNFSSIQIPNFFGNLLSGEIPDCWNHWRRLGYLDLENNNLTGQIPPSLGHLNPSVLNLRNNDMFGELPSTLQHSTSLIMLDLSDNHFSGSVPAWIGDKLSKLEILSLRSNNFNGHIPQKICQLQSLRILDLDNNNISGSIPKLVEYQY